MKTVLFACVHNAGRSQMGAAWFNALAHPERARAISAGTEPGPAVHPLVLEAMLEVGIDLSNATPQFLSLELAEAAALLITMGCGEACPAVPGLRRLDWPLEDPKGKPLERVRQIREDVRGRVLQLLADEGWALGSCSGQTHVTPRGPTFEAASAADLDGISAVLAASGLPVADVAAHLPNFLLAKCGATIGTVALEYAGDAALLRSLCVVPEYRGQAIGARLLSAIETVARSRGVRELYLLTTSAAAFFERQGFSLAPRAAAPPSIRGTAQFLSLCPASAICMRKSLGAASGSPGMERSPK